jgi:hypothetical protein
VYTVGAGFGFGTVGFGSSLTVNVVLEGISSSSKVFDPCSRCIHIIFQLTSSS